MQSMNFRWAACNLGPVHTILMRFQKYERFTLSSKTHRSNRVHTTVHDAFSTVHTKTLENDRTATNTRACLFDRSH